MSLRPPDGHALGIQIRRLFVDKNVAELTVRTVSGQLLLDSWSSNVNSSKVITALESSEEMAISLKTNAIANLADFELELIVSTFLDKGDRGHCPAHLYFDCRNNRCVRDYYLCDGINNCKNNSDEVHCQQLTASSLVLMSVCLVISLIYAVYKTFQKILGELSKRPVIRSDHKLTTVLTGSIKHGHCREADTYKPLLQ